MTKSTKELLEVFRQERALDREMWLEAIREIVGASNRASDASAAQAQMLSAFFSNFMSVDSPPESRVMRDADEIRIEQSRFES